MTLIKEAAELLGVDSCSFYNPTTRYSKYVVRSTGKNRDTKFDLAGYQREVDLKEELTSMTGVFIEYLNKEQGIPYKEIAQRAQVQHQTLWAASFGYRVALKVLQAYRASYEMKAFDIYYGLK